jgi:hypothetical protein
MLVGAKEICSSSSIIALLRDRFEMHCDKEKVDFVSPRILRSISASISPITDRDPIRLRLDLDRRSHPDDEPDIRRDLIDPDAHPGLIGSNWAGLADREVR